jgi:exodeoxyribonuclease VII small subunit
MSQNFSFEQAYKRLEEILEKLSNEQISLEEALKIYEEADQLIRLCNEKLSNAEQKVQTLVKGRNQELVLQEGTQKPVVEEFSASKQQYLNRNISS